MKCRVCDAKSEGMHFGVEACRPCAAFFRRSISYKRDYVCRSGTNHCSLTNMVRNACRKCRLQKCLEVGMMKESVQPNRDPLKNCVNNNASVALFPHLKSESPSVNEETVEKKVLDVEYRIPKNIPCSSTIVTFTTPTEEIIDIISRGYVKLCRARIKLEISEFYQNMNFIPRNSYGLPAELKMGNFQKCLEIFRSSIPLFADFLRDTFEGYNLLPQKQKWLLFRHFVQNLTGIEYHFLTKLYFPDLSSPRFLSSFCTYLDLNHLDEYFGSEVGSPFARFAVDVIKKQVDTLRALQDVKVDHSEMATLVALTLFSEGIDDLEIETKQLIYKMREKIFFGMHYYYTERLGLSDYAYRLGEAISLIWLSKKCRYKFKNAAETYELFGFFNVGEILYKDFDQSSL